jgi:hypothetical protein
MSSRAVVAMSELEVEEFLAEQRTVVLAVPRAEALPHVTPLWYVPHGLDLHMWTYSASQKTIALRRDPRAVALVEDGQTYPTLRGVSLDCAVTIVDDPAAVLALGIELETRYSGRTAAADVAEAIRRQAAKRVGLILRPTRIRSWDHRKLGGPR